MNRLFAQLVLVALMVFFAFSCTSDMRRNISGVPVAFGSLNHVTVIADKDIWEGPVGDTLQYYFGSPFLILPQPEPVFDLNHFTWEEVATEEVRKKLHTYLIVANVNNPSSPAAQLVIDHLGKDKISQTDSLKHGKMAVAKNKWAADQLLIYLYGNSDEDLFNIIAKGFPAARRKIYETHQNRLEATVFHGKENGKVMESIKGQLGVDIRIPSEYVLAKQDGNTFWLRKEMDDLSSNLLLTKVKYRDTSQLSKAGIKYLRDSLGRKYVSTRIENTYMVTNDVDLPMFLEKMTINNRFAAEAHGIWEIENDYMGGPFVSYAIINENTGEVFFMDGFVFAPGKDKRDHIQFLEAICRTAKF